MKIAFYRFYYAMLNGLSNIVGNRKLIKYKIMIGTTLLLLTSNAHGQTPKRANKDDKEKQDTIISDTILNPDNSGAFVTLCYYQVPVKQLSVDTDDPDKIYELAAPMPEFPGGMNKYVEFVKANFVYPPTLQESAPVGRVVIQLVVEKDGSLTNPVVVRSVDPAMDQAALDVINKMPKWIPGKIGEETVRVKYTLPVSFKKQ